MRKVIQLETFIGKGIENLFALCDDGAIFAYSHDGEWWKLPPIPQDDSQSEPARGGAGSKLKDDLTDYMGG